jgi:hypothetical protein
MSIRKLAVSALAGIALVAALVGPASACQATVTVDGCGHVKIVVTAAENPWTIVLKIHGQSATAYSFTEDSSWSVAHGTATVVEEVAPGTYDWKSTYTDGKKTRNGDSGSVTLGACSPTPLGPSVVQSCQQLTVEFPADVVKPDVGTATDPADWELIVEPGDLLFTDFHAGDNAVPLTAGHYTLWQLRYHWAGTWWDETGSGAFDIEACLAPTDPAPPTVAPTPFESFQGETATPISTPFESFQGETATPVKTATPPPTNTGGTDSSSGATPLLVLLICLGFAGIGLIAVQAERRSIRRQ